MVQESQNTSSLYDFLYLDTFKINTLISQLTVDGVKINFKKVGSLNNKSSANAGVHLPFLKAGVSGEEGATRGHESVYDTSHNHPLELLSLLQEKNLICRDIKTANLGGVVLLNGSMRVFDAKLLTKLVPVIGKVVPNLKNDKNFKLGLEFFSNLPHTVQVDLVENSGSNIWMSLDSNYLKINTGDIALKYGSSFPDKWYVLGILDARPHSGSDEQVIDWPKNDMRDGLNILNDMIFNLAGRSEDAYGFTPIVIFREIKVNDGDAE